MSQRRPENQNLPPSQSTNLRSAQGLAVFLAALIGALVGVPVLPLGLGITGLVVWPLALALSGTMAALGASMTSNLLKRNSAAVDVGRVVKMTILCAFGVALAFIPLAALVSLVFRVRGFSPLVPFGLAGTALALAATVFSERHRVVREEAGKIPGTAAKMILVAVLVLGLAAGNWLLDLFSGSNEGSERDAWCRNHVVEIIQAADGLPPSSPRFPKPPPVLDGDRYDAAAYAQWKAQYPNQHERACRAAYEKESRRRG